MHWNEMNTGFGSTWTEGQFTIKVDIVRLSVCISNECENFELSLKTNK